MQEHRPYLCNMPSASTFFRKCLQRYPWLRWASNKFVLASLFFLIWMSFLDVNSLLIHRQLNRQIDELQESIHYYRSEIKQDSAALFQLESDAYLEQYAREKHYMKKPGEEVFIIRIEGE